MVSRFSFYISWGFDLLYTPSNLKVGAPKVYLPGYFFYILISMKSLVKSKIALSILISPRLISGPTDFSSSSSFNQLNYLIFPHGGLIGLPNQHTENWALNHSPPIIHGSSPSLREIIVFFKLGWNRDNKHRKLFGKPQNLSFPDRLLQSLKKI